MAARICLFAALTLVVLAGTARADFTISKKATHDVSCSSGMCTATAKNANLNVSELADMLAGGDTTVKTGGGAITVQVLDGFTWSSTSRLTLKANKSVGFHNPVVVAGKGALTISYNSGSGGDLLFPRLAAFPADGMWAALSAFGKTQRTSNPAIGTWTPAAATGRAAMAPARTSRRSRMHR